MRTPSPKRRPRGLRVGNQDDYTRGSLDMSMARMSPVFSPKMRAKVRQAKTPSKLSVANKREKKYGSTDIDSPDTIDYSVWDSPTDDTGHEQAAGSTYLQTLSNAINLLLGVGVLSLPFMLREAGWVIGVTVLLALSLLTNLTGKLLGRIMARHPECKGFPEMATAAYGKLGFTIVSIVFYTELTTVPTMFLILMAQNLQALFPVVLTHTTSIFTSALVVLPTMFISRLEFLSYFSLLGIVAAFFLLVVLIIEGSHDLNPGDVDGSWREPAVTEVYTSIDRWPLVFGLVMVGYAGHACFPTVYMEMEDVTQYDSVLNVSYAFVMVVYVAIAVVGYMMYGVNTQGMVTLNFDIGGDGAWLVKMATWLVVINPATKFALTMSPVSSNVEGFVLPMVMGERYTHGAHGDDDWPVYVARCAVRTVLTGACMGLALSIPNFAQIVSFIGAACSFTISGVCPVVFYLKLCGDELSPTKYCMYFALACTSMICALVGTIACFVCVTN